MPTPSRPRGSEHSDFIQQVLKRRLHPIQSVQPRLSIFDPDHARDLLPYCAAHNVGVIVHSPLAKGLLAGKYRPGHVFPPDDERSGFDRFQGERFAAYLAKADHLKAIAEARGLTLPQFAVAWTLREEAMTVCLVGAKNGEQARENAVAGDVVLTPEELKQIEVILAET